MELINSNLGIIGMTVAAIIWAIRLEGKVKQGEDRDIRDYENVDGRIKSLAKRVDQNNNELKNISLIHTDVEVIKTKLDTIEGLANTVVRHFINNKKQ